MKYPLLAWSEGNCAGKSGLTKRACPYQFGSMREAWLKGFAQGVTVAEGYKRSATAARERRRLAA
jgi:ribosome modulation factor